MTHIQPINKDLPPPTLTINLVTWLRINLFSSTFNTLLTLTCLYLLYLTIPPFINWAFIQADWFGDSRADCTSNGACWAFIFVRFNQFIYGFYPENSYWRVNLTFILFVLLIFPLFIDKFKKKIALASFILTIYPIIAYLLLYGGYFGLTIVETDQWGGLMLTLLLAITGSILALPLGILLALGRRSTMPIIKILSIVFIEFWRGVPLITVLFMASVMLPLFLPDGVNFDKLLRALIGIVLFEAAYMAEVVRGGLQAIPKGQYEAAKALGLTYWNSMIFIILPQALKLVIPGIVNTFIALFKDTTLVLIIGLLDVLAVIHNAFTDPNWLGYSTEGYVFAAFIFWIFCFSLSRYSQYLEKKLHN